MEDCAKQLAFHNKRSLYMSLDRSAACAFVH